MIQFWYWKKKRRNKGFLDMTHILIWGVYNMKADFRWFFFFFFFASDKGKMKMFGFEVMEKKESFEKLN